MPDVMSVHLESCTIIPETEFNVLVIFNKIKMCTGTVCMLETVIHHFLKNKKYMSLMCGRDDPRLKFIRNIFGIKKNTCVIKKFQAEFTNLAIKIIHRILIRIHRPKHILHGM